jgi:mRNA interferase MazF
MLRRGDVVLVDLGNREGSVQFGVRPVIIVGNNMSNEFSPVISIVPLTTSKFKKNLPTHVNVTTNNSLIQKDSVALCEQLMVIDKKYILKDKPLFALSNELMKRIDTCLIIQLGLIESISNRIQMVS